MERISPPETGDEKAMLVGYLDYLRATVVSKLDGVPDDKIGWSPVDSGTSLGGLVRHLTGVEDWWCSHIVGRGEMTFPWDDSDPDSDMRPPPGATARSLVEAYAAECARSNAAIAAAGLDDLTDPDAERPGRSTRWVLLHLIAETARHAGHADIVREQLDGATGY